MNPPDSYHEILRKLNKATELNNELIAQLKECNHRLYESNEKCEMYKKAYAFVKKKESKITKSNL